MVISRRHLGIVVLGAGFAALLLVGAALHPGNATARPYNWTDIGPEANGDPTGDDQPSPTPKPTKVANRPHQGIPWADDAQRFGWGRIHVLWNAYRPLLPLVPRF